MDISGGNLFDLQASLTLDVSDYDSEVDNAIDQAETLADALSDLDGEVDIDTDDVDDAKDDVEDINDALDDLDGEVDIDASSAEDAKDDVEEVADSISDITSESGTASGGISDLANTIIDVLAGAAVVGAISSVTDSVWSLATAISSNGDTIDKQSQIMGVSRKAYQEWDYILRQNGSSMQASGRVFKSLTNSIADGKKGFTGALKEIGLSYKDISKMSTEDAFSTIVTSLQNLDESSLGDGVTKQSLAMDLLGNSAIQLMPLLNQSAESIQALRDNAEELGIFMSDSDVDAAVEFGDALDTFNATVEGLKNNLADQLLPVLTNVLTSMSSVVSMFNQDEGLTDKINALATGFVTSISEINGTDLQIDSIITELEKLSNVESMTPEQIAEWDALISQLGKISPELAGMFDNETHSISVSTEELLAHKDALIEDMKAKALAAAAQGRVDALAEAGAQVVDLKVEADVKQNIADSLVQSQESNIRAAAELLGEQYSAAFEMAIAKNTDENGVTDWLGVAVDSDLMTDSLYEMYGASAEDAAAAQQLVADATQGVADATAEAAAAQAAYQAAQTEYDTQAAATNQWLASLENVMAVMDAGAAGEQAFGAAADEAAQKVSKDSATVKKSVDTSSRTLKSFVRDWNNTTLKTIKGTINVTKNETTVKDTVQKSAYYYDAVDNNAVDMIVDAISNTPINVWIDDRQVAIATRNATAQQQAIRQTTVNDGFGKGGVT